MLSIFIDGILFFFYSYGFVNGKSHKILFDHVKSRRILSDLTTLIFLKP